MMHGHGGVYGGWSCLFIQGGKLYSKKNTKIIYNMALDGRSYILHAITNHNNAGMTEGGWDRMCDQVGTLGKHNSIMLGLLSTSKLDPLKYAEEGNMTIDNNK
jgi:hypothetical protein